MELEFLRKKVYSGVLGKLIGVYLGRPVEGWAYQDIRNRFNEVNNYVHKDLDLPLIVADDDISGTFGFFRALEDCRFKKDISAKDIGETWLNYIIEDKTILWWGGLGRSTEHTAYLNLKHGIPAPQSGSIAQNSKGVAEQIGAQIFMEAFAMCYPNEPDKAVELVRKAASVSHDGMAVDAACHLAALDSMAFCETNIDRLLDDAYAYVKTDSLKKLICDVRNICSKNSDWRETREDLEKNYGYHLYPGTCHVAPNHALVLASILHGGDDFQKSVMISASAGWDTDCNAGNVGAFNGIRLGLDAICEKEDLRTEVADRMYIITSDGGESVTDAVIQTNHIMSAYCHLHDLEAPVHEKRFSFSLPGALQGFCSCPYFAKQANVEANDGSYISIACENVNAKNTVGISTPTFPEFTERSSSYLSTASPSLYESQEISCVISKETQGEVSASLYVVYRDGESTKQVFSPPVQLSEEPQEIKWRIPELFGSIILRAGVSLSSVSNYSGNVKLHSMDWSNAPANFSQSGVLMTNIWDTSPVKLQMWTSSAKHFSADMIHTYCISHPEDNGVTTIGTLDWKDYSVTAKLFFGFHKTAGLVARVKGHRQYYGAVFSEKCASIIRVQHGERKTLTEKQFVIESNKPYNVTFSVVGDLLQLSVDNDIILETKDTTYSNGGCGFVVDSGTFLADGIQVNRVDVV